MQMNTLFEKAFAIESSRFIKEIRFDEKQLDIFIDFRRGVHLLQRPGIRQQGQVQSLRHRQQDMAALELLGV